VPASLSEIASSRVAFEDVMIPGGYEPLPEISPIGSSVGLVLARAV